MSDLVFSVTNLHVPTRQITGTGSIDLRLHSLGYTAPNIGRHKLIIVLQKLSQIPGQ